MTADTYSQWADELTRDSIRRLFVDRGCDVVFRKVLASNDNTKNQIYLGSDLTQVARIPSGPISVHIGSSMKERAPGAGIYRAPLDLVWITERDPEPAPEAKLIFYPQYPEVRASGLLRGTRNAPGHLLDPNRAGRTPGRVLLLGVSANSTRIHALLLPAGRSAGETADLEHLSRYGVLDEWRIGDASTSSPMDPRSEMLRELRRVHLAGWIPSCRLAATGERIDYTAQNGAGFTLEAELGVTPNGHSAPDFLGWEVKQHSVGSFARPSFGSVTLFTPEPDGGTYVDEGAAEFVRRWGHQRSSTHDRIDFTGTHSVDTVNDRTGLALRIDGFDRQSATFDPGGRIALVDASGSTCATWSFAKLLGHWKRKHAAAVFVRSERRQPTDHHGRVWYRYGSEVQTCEGASFERLLEGFASGVIRYDPGLHITRRPDGTWQPRKRNQFRVSARPERIAALYERSSIEDVGRTSG
jgi:hypothetical protein